MLRRIEIGGGPSPAHPDYEQVDLVDWSERTGLSYVLADARALPYEDGSCGEVFASNILEHFGRLETVAVLREWARVLAPGGRLTVIVPDVLGIFEDYRAGRDSFDDLICRLYGGQTYELDLHRTGFTRAEMPRVFAAAGLRTLSCVSSHAGGGVTIMGARI